MQLEFELNFPGPNIFAMKIRSNYDQIVIKICAFFALTKLGWMKHDRMYSTKLTIKDKIGVNKTLHNRFNAEV